VSALAERTALATEPRLAPLDARGRIEALFDPGSLNVIRSTVLPRRQAKRTAPGDGGALGEGAHAASRQSTALCPPNPNAFEIPMAGLSPFGSGRASLGT